MPILVRSAMPASERCGMNEPNTRLGWPLIRKTRSQIRTNPSSSPLARLRVPPPGRHASHDAAELLEMPMSTLAPRLIPSSRCQDCQSYRASGRAGAEFVLLHSQMHSAGRQSLAFGGARRDRTDDLKLAKLALSQLSYGPDPSDWQRSRRSSSNLQGAHTKSGGPGKI